MPIWQYRSMHPQRTGVMLGFFLLTLHSIASFVDGKAFPGDNYEGNSDYHYKQALGTQHQPFYRHQSFPPKTNLYYTPHINGQPIFIPAISGSASHTDKLLDDYYERYKEYTQSWTLATPVTYNYDHGNQRDYYEDPATSNSMVKDLLDDSYQDGVHRGSYHILPITRESNLNDVTKKTEDFKNRRNKQNLLKKDKVKDFYGLSMKNPVSVNYETKSQVSKDHASEVSEVINIKLPGIDYAPEVVQIDTKLSDDDYVPEVVQIIGNTLPDDDYAPKEAETFNEKLPDEDYAPEVMEVISTKLSDPEVVEIIGGTFPDEDYAPEVVEVVHIKNHGRKKHPSKTELLLESIEDKDSDETIDKETFKSKKDKTKIKSDKKAVKKPSKSSSKTDDYEENEFDKKAVKKPSKSSSKTDDYEENEFDKKAVKKPSKSSSKTDDYEENEFVTKESDKKKNINWSLFTEEHETIGEHLKTVKTKPDLRPTTEDWDELKVEKTKVKSDKKTLKKPSSGKSEDYEVIEFVAKKSDTNKESSQKLRTESGIKHASEDEYITDEKHEVIKRRDDFIDDSENPFFEDSKTNRSSLESIENLSERTFHDDDDSNEKLSLGDHEGLSKEPLNNPERFEAFDLENTGSGEPEEENDEIIRSNPQFFHNIDSIRSLTSLNSNIWSLIFNPSAEFKKSKKCVTRSNETGFCMYVHQCDVPNIITSFEELLNNSCVIDDVFIGICCPEFPVQTVKVRWEQMPSNFGEHTEDEFGHNADDCGIRSNEASKAQSWPWKAPLVSMSNGKIFCGGVIINEDYILTAAHCTTKIPRNQILVRLGQHDDSSGEDFAVVEIKRHAQYNPRTMHNDIALLKLGRRIVRDEQTDAACLPDDDDEDKEYDHAGERAVLLGWQRSFSKSVKDEILEVLTNEECEKRLGIKVPSTFLCTEARIEDERTCNADSGAPLVIKDDDKYEVIGILSWNRDDCNQRFPSKFSRVSKYVQWIKKHAV